ncbi:MAG: hypothetical protein IJM74_04445 [Bacteroidales bacterium]|nr:hypothetical protein [Bacteroidales bacterium]
MKQRSKFVAALLLLIATCALFAGCKKENEPNEPSQVEVNPAFVPIDWEKASVQTYDDSTGNYQIQFDGSVPDIHVGSIIAIDRDTVVLYRFVTSATVSGNTVNVTTVEAYLTDIFANTEFTLSTMSEGTSKSKGIVIYPHEAYVLDGKGGYQAFEFSRQRKEDTPFTHELWNRPLFDLDGQVLASGNNWRITLDHMNASLGIDLEMLMNFGGRTEREMLGDAIEHYRSRALKVEAALVGRFDTEQQVGFHTEGNFSYTPDYDLWKHNLFRPASIKFMVGPVPIVLTLRSDLFRQVEASGSGEISAYSGFTNHAECRFGFVWNQSDGINPVSSAENTFTFIPPTIEGRGQLQGKVWVFPRVSVMLYDAVGPSFDFMPYLADTLRGGFREQTLGQNNDYCAWSLDCNAGLNLRGGLSLRFLGYEVENYSTPRLNCVDRRLYHSPKRIVHESGRPALGQTQEVSFTVYDQNYLLNREVLTPLSQMVKFEANGQLSSKYGIVHDGIVSVSWTPVRTDTLYAKLYDFDGNVISFDTVQVYCDCDVTGGEWVDFELPSGLLWSSHNVGANTPDEFGSYFAWGEVHPKYSYNWDSYQYYVWQNLTKYTGSDGLTTLTLSDDAASVNMGNGARIPSKLEWEELVQNTSSRWTIYNGAYGRCITGLNGNSIFLPAAGDRWDSSVGEDGVNVGHYWSSSLHPDSPYSAWRFGFDSVSQGLYRSSRSYGRSVRAVRAAQ